MTNDRKKILVLGAGGLAGSAVMRSGLAEDYELVAAPSSYWMNLSDFGDTVKMIGMIEPDVIVNAAAKVGGIEANNSLRGEFIHDNLRIEINVIEAARLCNTPKLIFLGSSCIYPRNCPQPIKEEYFLTGPLEQTNRPYAVAKIAGIEMCDAYRSQYGCDFVSLMPTNLYGPNDNYDTESSHVLPAMIRRFHEAKINNYPSVQMWGTGKALREFMHADDLASAISHIIRNDLSWTGPMNVGTGLDVRIKDLANLIADIVGYNGEILWDGSRPDGTPRKQLDVSMIHEMGWHHKIHLEDGILSLYEQLKNKSVDEWKRK